LALFAIPLLDLRRVFGAELKPATNTMKGTVMITRKILHDKNSKNKRQNVLPLRSELSEIVS
jgi:hypothetical protein